MVKRKAIRIVKNYLTFLCKNNFKIQRAYIFGSFAKSENHKDSDIDLAIVLNGVHDVFEVQIHLMNLRRNNLELMIEPHPFKKSNFNLNNPLVYEIQKNGIKVY